jgi:hypothetical protein
VRTVMGEYPLERDRVRSVLVNQLGQLRADHEEPLLEGHLRRGADDPEVHQRRFSRRRDIHNTNAAPGQAGVDAQHPERHRLLVFVQLGLDLGSDLEIGEDVLHVVAVFERVDETEDLAGRLGVDLDGEIGHELEL